MENKEFTDIACAWAAYRERLESAQYLNRKALESTLASKSFWLAPEPKAFYIFFTVMFLLGSFICIAKMPGYWPVPALCLFGAGDMVWQQQMRDRIRRLDGGVVGMQRNLLKYRRWYIILSIAMFPILAVFMWWFGYFFDLYEDTATAVVSLGLLGAACLVVYAVRTRKTFRALGDLTDLASQLGDLTRED